MAADIAEHFGVQPELMKASIGTFDVVADGTLVFSKHRTGRFPENAEVLQALRALLEG